MTDVLVVATDRTSLGNVESHVRALAKHGASVCLVCTFDTRELPDLGQSDARHLRLNPNLRSGNPAAPWSRIANGVRAEAVSLRLRRAPLAKRVAIAAEHTGWLHKAASDAAALIAADRDSAPAVKAIGRRHRAVWTGLYSDSSVGDLIRRVDANYVVMAADEVAEMSSRRLDGDETGRLLAAWRLLMGADGGVADRAAQHATHFMGELLRLRKFDAAETVATEALERTLLTADRARLELQLLDARLSMLAPVRNEFEVTVRTGLQHADQALAAGQLQIASDLLVGALRVAFHRELHADGLSSPLVDNPEEFMKVLRESAAFRALGSPTGDIRTPMVTTQGRSGRRVLIIPGAYANFSQNLISGLGARPNVDVRVLDLKESYAPFRNVTTYPPLVHDRLTQAVDNATPPTTHDEREHLSWADTIVVDWCDNNAVWIVMHAPDSARIVVRIHSIDALSSSPHLIDWSKVSDVIFVGDHIRSLVTRAVPDLARETMTHVVPNLLRLNHLGLPKNARADRTLALVGWAQRVKDPLFAVEVIARLRAIDDSWRLMLVGHDFARILRGSEARYREVFRQRAVADDVRDAIEYVGYTSTLPEVLRDIGFILSCSRRESQGVALTEGTASAAVPVVRNWPMFAAYDGARSAFAEEWVVDTTDQAAQRILAHADASKRRETGAAARRYVMERYDQSVVADRLFDILIG